MGSRYTPLSGVILAGVLALQGCTLSQLQPSKLAIFSSSNEQVADKTDLDEPQAGESSSLPVSASSSEGIAKGSNSLQPEVSERPNEQLASVELDQAAKTLSIWPRLRSGFTLDVDSIQHKRINNHLNWYSRNKGYMKRVSTRANRYLYHIVETLEDKDLPLELALLPIVESAFDPFAYSHGRASGMWQFIPGTGRLYGLKQNWWYDGRRDVVASTQAATKYLKYLNRRFKGDWLLALAAYNTGEGNLQKAINRNKRRGRSTDFWSLKLPRETKAYVPQLIALAKIVKNPEQYGIELKEIPNSPYFATVDIESQIDLSQASRLADITMDELYALNPGFNRWATDPDGPHSLNVPVEKEDKFSQQLAVLPKEQRIGWHRYKVKSGDSLISIAKKFHTSVKGLKKANKLRGNMIRAGKSLMIPTAMKAPSHYAQSTGERTKRTQSRSAGKDKHKVIHVVRAGDSFWKIAQHYGVRVSSLAKWNAMAPKDTLQVGQELVVWTKNSDALAAAWDNPLIRKVPYRVRRGDSLAKIAGKFNLSVNDILRWNTINRNKYLQPGQRLTLFVDVRSVN
ncbi:MAG: LysM peptidoglycan-binding domain-containing protein [Cellvibrionaceae bacterium]